MKSFRNFTFAYSPVLTLAIVIIGLYAMAFSIGSSLDGRPTTHHTSALSNLFHSR